MASNTMRFFLRPVSIDTSHTGSIGVCVCVVCVCGVVCMCGVVWCSVYVCVWCVYVFVCVYFKWGARVRFAI